MNLSLRDYIVGQKRTGKNKQFVFILDDYAIKGPYTNNRLQNVIKRSEFFSHWNTPNVVKVIDIIEETYVRFPNIMKGYKLDSEMYKETFSDYSYRILKNPPVIDVKKSIENKVTFGNNLEDVILTLCHCNILGVGDMNLRNTMFDKDKNIFYVIDYDDSLTADRDDEVFYFNKRPGEKLGWYNLVKQHYNNVAKRLVDLLTDVIVVTNKLESRVERCIHLLKKYSENVTNVVSVRVNDIRPKYKDL